MQNSTMKSTMTTTAVSSPLVSSKKVATAEVEIGGQTIDTVSQDVLDNSPSSVPSSFVLTQFRNLINGEFANLKTFVETVFFSPVLSDPIIQPFFLDENWTFLDFILRNGKLQYTNDGGIVGVQATARVTSPAFVYPGKYFCYIQVLTLTSGTLEIKNERGIVLQTITSPGTYRFEFDVVQPTIALLDTVLSNVNQSESCIIDHINVHYIKTPFTVYMEYLSERILSGGSGFASLDDLAQAFATCLSNSQTYTNQQLNLSMDEFRQHIADRSSNPHGINPDIIRAAHKVHEHKWTDLTDLTGFDQIILDVTNSIATITNTLDTHTSATGNVHDTTPGDIGAAPAVHNHKVVDITDLQGILDQLDPTTEITEINNQIAQIIQSISEHINTQTGNPHSVTSEDVGLGNVENYPPATPQEAIDGVLTDRIMTPATTHSALTAVTNSPEFTTTRQIPVPVGTANLNFESEITLPLAPNRRYTLEISGLESEGLNKVCLALNTKNNPNVLYQNIYQIPSSDFIGTVWSNEFIDRIQLIPTGNGLNSGTGLFTLSTKDMLLTGSSVSRTVENGIQLSPGSLPVILCAILTPESVIDEIIGLVVYTSDGSLTDVSVSLYEHMEFTQEPALVIDATPVGVVVKRIGTTPPPGWVLKDGSELSRAMYPELFALATAANLVIDDAAWQAEVLANGFTDRYSSGDYISTFRVPKTAATSVENEYIKARYVQIPEPNQMLFAYAYGE